MLRKPVTKVGRGDLRSLVEDRCRQATIDNEVDVAHVRAHAAHDERVFYRSSTSKLRPFVPPHYAQGVVH